MTLLDPSARTEPPDPAIGGEYLVLVQPHLHNEGRRLWVVMATFDHDERNLAVQLAEAYEGRGHTVAVAKIELESEDETWDVYPPRH